jgi:hypothetical protein
MLLNLVQDDVERARQLGGIYMYLSLIVISIKLW